MADYQLEISFSDEQLDTLFTTKSNVIVAKPTGGSSTNVAWQVFQPFENNSVTWSEEYGIYVSNTKISNGATLTQMSSTSGNAQMDTTYTMQPSAIITGPADGGTDDAFTLVNKYANLPYLTVGLYQNAVVNGVLVKGNAISAVPTLYQSTAVMTPFTTVYLWLQSEVSSNTVVSVVTSPMTQLTFGGGVNEISVSYDSATGTFIS